MAASLLKINLKYFSSLKNLADNSIKKETLYAIEKCLDNLNKISESLDGSDSLLENVLNYEIVKQKIEQGFDEFSSKERKIIAWNLYSFVKDENSVLFGKAVEILNRNFSPLCISGITFCLLQHWYSLEKDRVKIFKFFESRIKKYDGNLKKINLLKSFISFFDTGGAKYFAVCFANKFKSFDSIPETFGYSSKNIGQEYYSDAIVEFTGILLKYNQFDYLIENLKKIFDVHSLERTKKLCVATMILVVDEFKNNHYENKIIQFAKKIINVNLNLDSAWSASHLSESDKLELKNARKIYKKWIAKRVIDVLFDSIDINDPTANERKIYWNRYIEYIENLKIIGSEEIKNELKNISKIKDFVDDYFILSKGRFLRGFFLQLNKRKLDKVALAMYIKDKICIEILENRNALYVYSINSPEVIPLKRNDQKLLDQRGKLMRIDDLKNTNMPFLISPWTYESTGRVIHKKNSWQYELDRWFRNKLEIDVRK